MPAGELARLHDIVEELSDDLPMVAQRRMFGCDGFFADQTIYALIWKTGRIGLKLPNEELFEQLMSMEGADPWTAGDRTISQWVLVPPDLVEDRRSLREWIDRAYNLARQQPKTKPSSASASKSAKRGSKTPGRRSR